MWCPVILFLAKPQAYLIPSPANSQWYFGENKIWIWHPEIADRFTASCSSPDFSYLKSGTLAENVSQRVFFEI